MAASLDTSTAATSTEPSHAGVAGLHDDLTIVDLHAHPTLKMSLWGHRFTELHKAHRYFNPYDLRTDLPKLRAGGVDVLVSSVCAPERDMLEECRYMRLLRFVKPGAYRDHFKRDYYAVTCEAIQNIVTQVGEARDPSGQKQARIVTSAADLDALLSEPAPRPVAVIHSVEGGHSLDARPPAPLPGDESMPLTERWRLRQQNPQDIDTSTGYLEDLHAAGVAILTLAHFYPNDFASSVFPYPESVQKMGCFTGGRDLTQGITAAGERVVEKMLALGMIIDVSHCTPPARVQIYRIVNRRAPIIATHVGAYEVNPSPYNLEDWEIQEIAATGGVVGVIFMNYWLMPHETARGLNYIARTLRHFMNAGGKDVAAVGTDYDGFNDPPDDIPDPSHFHRLTERLVAERYTEEEIRKIWGENALRTLRLGWKSV